MKNVPWTGARLLWAALLFPALLAGQTYFLGVSGGTATVASPGYAKAYFNPSTGPGFHLLIRVTGRTGCSFDFCFHDLPIDRSRFLLDKGGDAVSAKGSMNLDLVSMTYQQMVIELGIGLVDLMLCPDSLLLKKDLEMSSNTLSEYVFLKDIVLVVNKEEH